MRRITAIISKNIALKPGMNLNNGDINAVQKCLSPKSELSATKKVLQQNAKLMASLVAKNKRGASDKKEGRRESPTPRGKRPRGKSYGDSNPIW